ncbi:MAG: hypothetical protein KDC98_21510 [Planctomycetes bacterium]|nr:hypothetical protein [Planctomycetota bacterium]
MRSIPLLIPCLCLPLTALSAQGITAAATIGRLVATAQSSSAPGFTAQATPGASIPTAVVLASQSVGGTSLALSTDTFFADAARLDLGASAFVMAPSTGLATVDAEFLLDLTVPQSTRVRIELQMTGYSPAGGVAPTAGIDLDNNGTIDIPGGLGRTVTLQYTLTASHRMALRFNLTTTPTAVGSTNTQIHMRVIPDRSNITYQDMLGSVCGNLTLVAEETFSPGVRLRIDSFYSQLQYLVIGFTPTFTPLLTYGPNCFLMPSADLVIPTFVTPVTVPSGIGLSRFYAQAITFTNLNLQASNGILIDL